MTMVQVGEVLAGKYRVERILGQGGMGVVVAATHLQLAQRVALKFLLPEMVGSEESIERFLREARAAVQIRGERVARVLDVGTLDSGAPYMVMEYLDGTDLAALVRTHGALPITTAVDYVLQACEALAEAHALGIVHRDLKPANLFLTRAPDGSGLIKVLDFGISKRILPAGSTSGGMENASITATSAVMGSPLYMSPEQITSARDVDHRSDIWSLGVVLHELLTGNAPFSAETVSALMVAIAVSPPIPLRVQRPGLPASLEAVVARCMEKDRNRRFANVAELAFALVPFAEAGGGGALAAERSRRVLGVTTDPTLNARASFPFDPRTASASLDATGSVGTLSSWGGTGTHRSVGSRRLMVAGAAIAAVAAAASLAVYAFSDDKSSASAPLAPSASAQDLGSAAARPDAPEPAVVPAPDPAPAPAPETYDAPSEPFPGASSDVTRTAPAPAPRPRPAFVRPATKPTPKPAEPRGKDLFNDVD